MNVKLSVMCYVTQTMKSAGNDAGDSDDGDFRASLQPIVQREIATQTSASVRIQL